MCTFHTSVSFETQFANVDCNSEPDFFQTFKEPKNRFYVTEGNIMYFTDGCWFLISCVIQHYAPVVGWGWGEEQVHNVDYDPVPVMTLLCHCFNLLSRGNKYGISFQVSIYGPLSYGPSTLPLRHCCNVSGLNSRFSNHSTAKIRKSRIVKTSKCIHPTHASHNRLFWPNLPQNNVNYRN
jgi:hypothetical protein